MDNEWRLESARFVSLIFYCSFPIFNSPAGEVFYGCYLGYNRIMILVYNPAAFKHGITEPDIVATALVDELIEGFNNKYLVVGFSTILVQEGILLR